MKAMPQPNHQQSDQDDLKKLGEKIKYHEDNLKFLKTQMDNLHEYCLDMQVNLGKCYSSIAPMAKNENDNYFQPEENTAEQILRQENSAAGLLCELKLRDRTQASHLPLTSDVLGIVADLCTVEEDNHSRLFSEYLGLETMMAIVCKTYEGVKALEAYDGEGRIKNSIGLHGLGPSIGRSMDGRFLVICLEDLRPYDEDLIADEPQRKLALTDPRLPSGETPPGFLGFAVNMINLESMNLSYLTTRGYGLRETLFYSLFSCLQVYRTREEMLLSLSCISDGALSLDGGIIRSTGVFFLGNRKQVGVRFPISSQSSHLPIDKQKYENLTKAIQWKKEWILEDIHREQTLLSHVKNSFELKRKIASSLLLNAQGTHFSEMDKDILTSVSYEKNTFEIRIGLDSTVSHLRRCICEKWSALTQSSFDLYFVRDCKRTFIETDAELQCFACYGIAKRESVIQIFVESDHSSKSVRLSDDVGTSSSLCAGTYEDQIEVRQPLKSGAWANVITGVGQRFPGGAVEFRTKLLQYSIENGFKMKLLKNDTHRVTAECSMKEETGCKWRVHASQKFNNPHFFEIKRMVVEHTCGVSYRGMKDSPMTSKLVKSVILDQVRENPLVKPREIMDVFQRDYGVPLNYYFAYSGKDLAMKEIYGDDALSYRQLVWYTDTLRTKNPGSHVVLEAHLETRKFERLFIAFEACISGFNFCPPMLCLDGTPLKGKFKGCFLAATAKNGNHGVFPLAMAIVDSENQANWLWFLENLKLVVSDKRDLTFISDRHWGLDASVPLVFPGSFHSYCLWHLKNNLTTAISITNQKRAFIVKLLSDLAYAATHIEFKKVIADFRAVGVSEANEFLDNLPVEHFSNAYFQGNRYGEMCSNVAESFSSWILQERHMPITSMVDHIQIKLIETMSNQLELSKQWSMQLCPVMENKLAEKIELGRAWKVIKSSEFVFEVQSEKYHCVDLKAMRCSCNQWHIDGFPCEHAIVSILANDEPVYAYILEYYFVSSFRESYSRVVQPVPNNEMPTEIPDEAAIEPPDTKRSPGRPKRKKMEDMDARPKRLIECKRCKSHGHHNQKTCTVPIN